MNSERLTIGVSREAELENILGMILDEWDREELTTADNSSDVYREDLQADMEDMFEEARTILARESSDDTMED